MDRSLRNSTWRRLALGAGGATLMAALIVFGTTAQAWIEISMRDGRQVAYWNLVAWPAAWWGAWIPVASLVFELAWRFPTTRSRWPTNLLILLAGCLVAFAVHVGLQVGAMYLPRWQSQHASLREAVAFHVSTSLYLNVAIYWTVVALSNATRVYLNAHERALRAARLETDLAKARLDTLRLQLHPHFLFNTLHGLSALIYRDPAAADTMVSRLARLLRSALDRSEMHEVPLADELAFLREYVDLERIRFGDGLEVSFDIQPGLERLRVPTFVLQPLVENSIKHAVVPNGNRGRVHIRVSRNDCLRIEVSDDGPGMTGTGAGGGVGLSNLRSRLEALYDREFELGLGSGPRGGLMVCIELPVRDVA